ncbi:MAG: M1 family metallopeptidase [Phycisphaerae bacterium]|nr:M1 family metallopeptidase [Saprospiraceae bacterium]
MFFTRFTRRSFSVGGLLIAFASLSAQTTLFVPRNYLKPYELGTRSWDGKPGPNYWQNRAAYSIEASIDPKTRRLSGEETITYTNNSPDTLKTIRFKLQHDRYRKGVQRAFDVAASDVSDEGTRIESLTFNGKTVAAQDQNRFATFLDVSLKSTPVSPKSSVTFTLRWSYTLPAAKGSARECVCDSTTFFVPYWYPQIAVYDDLNGWASHPYTGQQEFYNDFSDYDVTIKMPAGFQVWATGEWQNAKDILNPEYFSRWQKAHTSAEVISVFSEKELKAGGVYRQQKLPESSKLSGSSALTSFHFKASDVPDFAFAASDHYNWDATSVVVDDKTGRRTFIGAVYNTASTDYPQVAKIASDGIRAMSTWLPGYPFPYPAMTVFNGDDGMEYPMMCNDVSTAPNSPMGLTVHEISHTYFPFMMGINEQDHAWMDEGWAAFFDYLLSDSLSNHTEGRVRDYSSIAGTENDVPPMVKSRNLSTAYRNASYQRPSQAYFTLLDLLGYEKFHACMTEYMNRWKGKHPAPFDFFQTWNNASGQNLDWFWRPWFFDWGYPDLGIQAVVSDEAAHCQVIVVQRKGNIPVPIHLEVEYSDGSKETFHQTAAAWRDGKQNVHVACAEGKTVKSVVMGGTTIPDVDRKDNKWPK